MTSVAEARAAGGEFGMGVPDHDDYLTDGRRLVQVVEVYTHTIEVENSVTFEVSRIPLATWTKHWRVVRWGLKAA